MSKIFKKIKIALDTRLDSVPLIGTIAWENTKILVTPIEMYVRPTFMPAKSARLDLISSVQLNQGIYQVDVFAPLNKGIKDVFEKMDDIVDHFKTEFVLTQDDLEVLIRVVSIKQLQSDKEHIMGTVQIDWVCYA